MLAQRLASARPSKGAHCSGLLCSPPDGCEGPRSGGANISVRKLWPSGPCMGPRRMESCAGLASPSPSDTKHQSRDRERTKGQQFTQLSPRKHAPACTLRLHNQTAHVSAELPLCLCKVPICRGVPTCTCTGTFFRRNQVLPSGGE